VRPEAWLVGRELIGSESLPDSLSAELKQWSYLGSFVELTFDTALGPVFVVSPEVERDWRMGQVLALSLPGRGVSVVAV
jgi:iron(III) transport system ATP-binding protein